MPTIALKSKVRTALERGLSLNIRHRLFLDQPSDAVLDMKPTIPEAVDVLLFSNVLITISGSLDGARITPAELRTSYIANHLVDFLQTNAGELGINAVSGLYISEDTNLLSFTLTASRHCASTDILPVHLKLIGLDIDYVWQTNSTAIASGPLDTAINPFAQHLSLPYLTATENAVGRFVSIHLVRRYPLIFGPWCKQLDVECTFFPSILISIRNIMERSRSPVFQATCQKMFKLCKRKITSTSVSAAEALSKYLGLEEGTYSAPTIHAYNEEEAFFLCLERFYRLEMKRPKFRHLPLFRTITTSSSEDLLSDTRVSLDENCSSNQSSEASSLLPYVSLFDGTSSSDLELNTEDERSESYRNNNARQESLDHFFEPFGANWAEVSDRDLCDDDMYDLSEDEVGSFDTGQPPWNSGDGSSDLAVDSDFDCLLEDHGGCWQFTGRDWSPDNLCYEECSRVITDDYRFLVIEYDSDIAA